MNKDLQSILNIIQRLEHLDDEEKNSLLKAANIVNKELEIESSLERVRTVAMSMNKPDDMLDVCRNISDQLELLNVKEIRNVQTAIFYKEKGTYMNYEYYAKHNKTFITETTYTDHKIHQDFADKMLKGNGEFMIAHIKGDEVNDWIAYQKTTNVFIDDHLNTASSLNYYWYSLGPVALGISTYSPLNEDETNLFKRFLKVFELSYRRYLDIEKAEIQAKEAQIENALEKVRSRSLAMHTSDELGDVVSVAFQKLKELGVGIDGGLTINILKEGTRDLMIWGAAPYLLEKVQCIFIPYFDHRILTAPWDASDKGLELFTTKYSFEEKNVFYKYVFEHTGFKNLPDEAKDFILSAPCIVQSVGLAKHSSIAIYSYEDKMFSDFENDVLKRFAKVFEQAYVRFLDIQKAEAQAREAQIEAALERVRSRSMAMQKSEELKEVIRIVYDQFIHLNINVDHAGFVVDHKLKSDWHFWIADKNDIPSKITTPYFDSAWGNDFNNAKEKDLAFFATNLNFEEKNKFYTELLSYVPGLPEESKKFYLSCPGLAGSTVLFEDVSLYIENFSGIPYSDEENKILLRFGKVFQQTYTRFLDLQKAETQSLETMKRASVDRVRAEIASMRTTTDLEKITPLIWNELTVLGIPFVRCGVFIMDEEQQQVQTFLYTEGKAITSFTSTFSNSKIIIEALPYWRRKEIYKTHWDEAAFLEQAKTLVEQGAVTTGEKYLTEHRPTGLYLHFLPFLQGMLYVGDAAPLSDEHLQLVQALADAFSTAYARYEDFNKLEAAKQQVDKTLVDLKQAQQQLVQSEKMASLGELTAGIAHEIQNPLNFVNNFSEVSNELIEELNAERLKPNAERNAQFENEILNDIKQNLEKINHHGKRADAIVKGMLQHSRSSAGEKERTDINALADEYLRLSYQGFRAKDKNFNSAIKTDLDNSIGKINIIPQDIGRVLLNLYNNAFYSVNEKQKTAGENYHSSVSVSTKKTTNHIEISVKDNGNGIPQKVVDKIFQPFFTTKPTGQGTGLGLSLSYDIIKAHGGEIKVETKESEGSKFIIQIPVV